MYKADFVQKFVVNLVWRDATDINQVSRVVGYRSILWATKTKPALVDYHVSPSTSLSRLFLRVGLLRKSTSDLLAYSCI